VDSPPPHSYLTVRVEAGLDLRVITALENGGLVRVGKVEHSIQIPH